jgi:hypothetical protein
MCPHLFWWLVHCGAQGGREDGAQGEGRDRRRLEAALRSASPRRARACVRTYKLDGCTDNLTQASRTKKRARTRTFVVAVRGLARQRAAAAKAAKAAEARHQSTHSPYAAGGTVTATSSAPSAPSSRAMLDFLSRRVEPLERRIALHRDPRVGTSPTLTGWRVTRPESLTDKRNGRRPYVRFHPPPPSAHATSPTYMSRMWRGRRPT